VKLACCVAVLCALGAPTPARAGPTTAPTSAVADRDPPPGLLRFRSFGSSEGLHNLVVGSLAQDARGDLWVGTDDGVDRYHGDRFTHFGRAQGLISTEVRLLGVGPDGELCVGSPTGLACFDGARFARVDGLHDATVTGIATAGGRLWVGTPGGLYQRDPGGHLTAAPGWPAGESIEALVSDGPGVIAAGTRGVRTTTGDGTWRPVPGLGDTGGRVDDLLRDAAGAVWIRTTHHLWRVARDGTRDDLITGLPSSYGVGGPRSMVNGARGELFVGTDDGVAYRDGAGWKLLGPGAPFGGARTVFVDRAGTLWVGAIGLYEWRGRGLLERHDQSSGLPGSVVWSMARDRDGALWTATSECLARVVAGSWQCLPGSTGRVVRSFVFAPHGGVFFGGIPAELIYVAPDGNAMTLPFADRDSADRSILVLRLGPEGDLWIGTRSGLFRLRGAVPGVPERVVVPGVPADARVAAIVVVDDQLWAATPNGLVVHDRAGWRRYGVADGLRSDSARYFTHTHGHGYCVAYTEAIGVSCFDVEAGGLARLRHLGPEDGLSTGSVYFVGEDRRGRLWIGTGDGVVVASGDDLEHFAESDGLAGDDAAANAFLADPDGTLWFGSTGGLARFHGERYDGPPPPPRARLRAGQLGTVAFHDDPPAGLTVPHDRSALRVELGVDALVDAARVEYQVRLTPVEATWSASAGRELGYPSLLPGAYRLEVRARLTPGAWGPVATLAFVVQPAWWQTRAVAVLAGGALLLALGLIALWSQRVALRRRTRQLHERSAHSLRALVEHIPDLISVHAGRKIVYCNAAARRMYGFAADAEVSGLGDRVHPDDLAAAEAVLQSIDAVPEVVPLRVRDDAGGWRTCEVSSVWMELAGAPALVVSGRDVTERHELRAQLLVSDRMASLGTLAAGIAHEINNPLAYVLGNLQLAAEALATPGAPAAHADDLKLAVADATDGAERVRKIVKGLRAFSRAEEEQRVRLDVAQVVRAAIRLTANEVRHRAELVLELGATPKVVADDGRLTQVVINLIVNAAHAIPEGRSASHRITVRTTKDARGQAVIEVIDTGAGMPPEVRARVFDPFYTTKAVGSGTGLGLSICHGIVTQLGGTIEIESAVARGTTVRVALPGAPVTTVIATLPGFGAELAAPARLRILLVDDEPQVVEMLARVLQREHDVVAVSCGRAALDHIGDGAWFDAIVSDVMMPNMTGLELLEALVERAPEQAQRLIFLSGGVFTPETRARLDDLGTLQLEKPISTRDLRQVVMQVASRRPQARGSSGPVACVDPTVRTGT